jgi:hypothetical protein
MEDSEADLETVFGDLAAQLPKHEDDPTFIFSRENLPKPPPRVSTSRFWFRAPHFKFYDHYPKPAVDLCTDKQGSTLLGLFILSVVFHTQSSQVRLVHHPAQLDLLRVRVESPWPDYRTTPESFSFDPICLTARHPTWTEMGVDKHELPMVQITTRDEIGTQGRQPWPEGCSTVIGFGSDRASVRMAELLLDIGLGDTEVDEYQFWSEFYYRSVAVGSLEFAIWLPGSLGYVESD